MTEQGRYRLAGVFSAIACLMMLTGLMVLSADSAEAYPDNARIVGNVSDGTNPVPNTYVKAMLFMGDGEEINWTMTDLNGDFEMMVPGGLSYVVFAANGSYYMIMNQVTVDPGETKYSNFTLTHITEAADVTISGYVTDEFGAPRSDGHVLGLVNNPMGGDAPYYANVTEPDATGYFEIKVIAGPRGGGAAGMDFPGYPMAMNETEDPFVAGSSYTFNIELAPKTYNDDAAVYGFVTEMGTGLPISGAIVSYESDVGMDRYSNWTMSNETGYYMIDVRAGDYFRLTYQRAGYTVKFIELDIMPGQTLQQDVELRKCNAVIRGNVTDEVTGLPMQFTRVFLVDDPMMAENMTMTMTDSAGQYELDAFDGTGMYFGAEAENYARNYTIIDVNPGDELWYDLTLLPYSAWLVGQVTDLRTGLPLQDAQVHIMGPVEEQEWTDWMGMYNFSVVPGDYAIEVNQWGWPGYETFLDNITIVDGVENVLNVALMPRDNALLKGHVFDIITGAPVQNANVWIGGMMWGNSTMSNETGYYEMFAADGDYDLWVNAMDYQGYSMQITLTELSETTLDFGLMPNNPEPTVRLHGYVNNSDDGTPIMGGAEVRIRIDGGMYENNTWTDFTGQYEMYVPAWGLNVKSTSNDHGPFFGFVNLSGQTDYELNIQLDRDFYEPNLTCSIMPSENISWSNPSWLSAMIEEQNLREMTLIRFMEWNSTGLDSNWTMIDWRRTSFDPWNPENGLGYSIVDGNYSVNDWWDASAQAGWLSNGVDSVYMAAGTWPWFMEPVYALSGYYTNATSPRELGSVFFNSSTGAFMGFMPRYTGTPTVWAPDPTGVFEPECLVVEYDDGWMVDFNWRTLDAWSVDGLTFTFDDEVPTGDYKSVFSANDWGNRGNWSITDLTVDQEPPVAEAGPGQLVPTDYVFTLDGTASYDNVGVAMYMWEFFNATGVWTVLWGDVVTYSFELPGSYLVNLTVWDGANHMSTDSLTVDVFLDLAPVADAGPDQDVDEDSTVYFDGSLSYDDDGIVDYTWYIAELSDWMFGMYPEYTFWDPGVYHVTLVVTDTVGHTSPPDEMVVTVHDTEPPIADAGWDQWVTAGTTVYFDGSWSWDNVGIVSYVWSFFDVMPVELYGPYPDYTFFNSGSYPVTLTVYDAEGNSGSDDVWVYVDSPPIADAGSDQWVNEDTIVDFDGSSSWDDIGIIDYSWYIEELGDWMYGVTPQYIFSQPGVYHVWLYVADTNWQMDDDDMYVTVFDVTPPTSEPGSDQWVMPGSTVALDGSWSWDNVGVMLYEWAFYDGDPVVLYGMTVDYTFNTPGSYQVWLTVYDAAMNWDMEDVWIYVDSPPVADAGPDQWVNEDMTVFFDGTGSWDDGGIIDYTWYIYEEDAWMFGALPTYAFWDPGVYNVRLTVTDTSLQTADDYMVVTVYDVTPPIADAGGDQYVGQGSMVTLDGSGSWDNDVIVDYVWSFFDVMPVEIHGVLVDYTFSAPGAYLVVLTVYDGASNSAWDDMLVTVDSRPIADAGPDQTVDEDIVVNFDGSLSWDDDAIVDWTWYIAELSDWMYGVFPSYTFWSPGEYHVTLVVMDSYGQYSDPDEMVVTVEDVTPPIADAGADQYVLDDTWVAFDGSGSWDNVDIVDYVWSFFDVMPVEIHGQTANYLFTSGGSYQVTLTVYDDAGNSAWDDMWVFVDGRPVADAGPDQTVDEDTTVYFDGAGSWDDDGIVDYIWHIVELDFWMYGVDPQYVFPDPGTFHVQLMVVDTAAQLSDYDEMVVTVNDVTPPTVVAGPDQRVNDGTMVTLDGSASTDNGVIVEYMWSFFDIFSVEIYGSVVTYTFNGPGSYWVDLFVTDGGGNVGSDSLLVEINGPPVASTPGDQWAYPGEVVWLSGWSCSDDYDGPFDLQYEWSFTYDGSPVVLTGNNPDVPYQFITQGIYTLYLTVTDTGGLSDSTSMQLFVFDYMSAIWVDPRNDQTLVDGATISLDYVTMRGSVEPWELVRVVTSNGYYETYADDNGLFEITDVTLSEGLNIATVSSYSSWYDDVLDWFKFITSDTYCRLWVDTLESPTSSSMVLISGWTDAGAIVEINGIPAAVMPDGTFGEYVGLSEGLNIVSVTAWDAVGNSNSALLSIELDTTPPNLVVSGPAHMSTVSEPNVLVFGTVDLGATVRVNGVLAAGLTDWSVTISLLEGANTVIVTATDAVGNTATQTLTVSYVPPDYVTPEELDAVRTELLGEISNLSAALDENVTALQDQIDNAMGEITALQDSLLENITALQGQIDGAMDEILALQTSLAENITALQDEINAALSEIAELRASVGENVTALQGQIDTAMDEIAGLQSSLLENVTALQSDIADAMADIFALETSLTENVTALQNQINDAVTDISDLQSALAENVTALTNDISALEAALQENVTALQQAIAANDTALQQALTQNVTALQSQIAALRGELQANVTSLTSALTENVTALQGLVDALDQNLADVEAELASVNATLVASQADMDAALDAIQADMTDLQDQIDEIEQATQDVEETAGDTDSFASMLMYLTLILFAIAIVMIVLVWYLANKKFGKGGAGKSDESLEEVEGPTEVEKEFESLEKEIKDEEL